MNRPLALAAAIVCLFGAAVPSVAAPRRTAQPAVARKKPPALCPDARFGVGTIVGVPAGGGQVLVVAGGRASLEGECTAAAVGRKATLKGTRVHAVWPAGACRDLRGRVKLQATIATGCGAIAGSIAAAKSHFRHAVSGTLSRCGDGVVDTGKGEGCDGGAGCPAGSVCTTDCTCTGGGTPTTVPGGVTTTLPAGATTTTLPNVTTRCCQAVGACIDVDPQDASALCHQVAGTLAAAGTVCDAANTAHNPAGPQCGAVASHGARCCQCPELSPPYPHPSYCFESSTSHCGSVCTAFDGRTCDPVSEACIQ